MKIAIRENELFKESDWQEHFKHDYIVGKDISGNNIYKPKIDLAAAPYNYQIVDVLDVYCENINIRDFDKINGAYVFNAAKRASRIELQTMEEELPDILAWFESYDRKISEHLRCQRLGMACHHNVVQLDIEARQKQERLAMIKTLQAANRGNQ